MKKIKQIKQVKQSSENDEPEKERNDLSSVRSDIDSTNSTIEKMQDFLEEHGVSSNLSTAESVQPMESASFPMDFSELQQRYKEQEVKKQETKKPEIIPFKKALESRRSDFEEIRQHLERRSQEMKKRVKKIGEHEKPEKGTCSADKKEDETSVNLSYHSTEFSPDLDCNLLSFRPSESLTNKEKLQIYSDKCRLEQSKETEDKNSEKPDADHGPTTHAIFAHLAKLKSVAKKPVCKLDLKVKAKAKAKVLEPVDSDPSLSLHRRDSQKSVTSRTSLRSSSTKNLDD